MIEIKRTSQIFLKCSNKGLNLKENIENVAQRARKNIWATFVWKFVDETFGK